MFSASIEMIMWFCPWFCLCAKFVYVEPFLYPWDETNLINMSGDYLNDLVCPRGLEITQ
jgi:hypothetical protein